MTQIKGSARLHQGPLTLEKDIPDEDIKMSTNITQLCEQKREPMTMTSSWQKSMTHSWAGSAFLQQQTEEVPEDKGGALFICSLGKGLKST